MWGAVITCNNNQQQTFQLINSNQTTLQWPDMIRSSKFDKYLRKENLMAIFRDLNAKHCHFHSRILYFKLSMSEGDFTQKNKMFNSFLSSSCMMNLVCMTQSRFSTVKIGSEDCESPGCKLFSISTPENLAHMQNKLCLIWNYQVIFLIQPQLNMRNISAESCKNISASAGVCGILF